MHSTPTAALEVILKLPPLGIYIEGGDLQNCSGEFTRAIFGHSEVLEKITDEWSSLLAPGVKIVPIIAFGRRFSVELPPKSSWLSQETLKILQQTRLDGSLCEKESCAPGSLTTVFQTEVYATLARSDFCRTCTT
jgi:hypothetical protein